MMTAMCTPVLSAEAASIGFPLKDGILKRLVMSTKGFGLDRAMGPAVVGGTASGGISTSKVAAVVEAVVASGGLVEMSLCNSGNK